ncbi:MAG: hypothetical protein DRI61_10505 [Chloroflexi bacterium]|nr:MAG: hypothetical protein DRI61_10505 [Chloroflexota bacterium]
MPQTSEFKPYHFVYTLGKGLLALTWLILVSGGWSVTHLPLLLLLIAVSLFSTLTAIRFGLVGMAFVSVIHLTAFLIGGLPLAGWTAFLSSLLIEVVVLLKPSLLRWIEWMEPLPPKYAFLLRGMDNAGTTAINILAAGVVYRLLGGQLPFEFTSQAIIPYFGLSIAYLASDFLWHSFYLLLRRSSPLTFFRENLKDILMLQVAPLPFAALTASIYLKLGWLLFILFILGVGGVSLIAKGLYRARTQLERRVQELSVINRIGQALVSYLDVNQILEVLKAQSASLLGEESIYLALYDEEKDEIAFPLAVEQGETRHWASRRSANGLTEYVIRTARPLLLNGDVSAQAAQLGIEPIGRIPKAWLGVPLKVGERVIGVLAVQRYESPEPYTQDDLRLLSTIASQVAIAIENARLYQRTDEALASKVQELEAVLDASQEGLLFLAPSGKVVWANAAAERLLGLEVDALIRSSPDGELDGLLGFAAGELKASLGELSRHPKLLKREYELPGPHYVEETILPVRLSTGGILGFLVALRDVTEERELERLREDLVHMIVHDLRSPLSSISLGVELLREEASRNAQTILNTMYSSSHRMLEMVNSLLDIYRLERSELPLSKEATEMTRVVREAVSILSSQASRAGVRIRVEAAETPPLEVDRKVILRVITNLLDNAIKHSPRGGDVTIRVTRVFSEEDGERLPRGRWVLVQVEDQGPGIPPAYRERIFDKFYQTPEGRRKAGFGLGLTFCKLAVEAHGGRIWADEAPGGGSAFCFALPLSGESNI